MFLILTEFVEYRGKLTKVGSLKPYSVMKIDVQCPECSKIRVTTMANLTKNGHHRCRKCSLKIANTVVMDVGKKYGRWTVISNDSKPSHSLCLCDCGTIRDVESSNLRAGRSKSCGCISAEINKSNRKYLAINSTYGRLTVIKPTEDSGFSICECECGVICTIANNRLVSGVTQSCGCLQKEMAGLALKNTVKDYKKEKHPSWKGGTTPINHRIRGSSEYSDWRTSVFERDDYTCQKCGQVGYELNAHHIIPFAEREDLHTEIDNGITFCKKCHINFHGMYGIQGNNIKQIKEFTQR